MPPRQKSLDELIAAKGWTPFTVAREAGLSVNTVKAWCAGESRPWRAKAAKLAKVLGVDVAVVILAAIQGEIAAAAKAKPKR